MNARTEAENQVLRVHARAAAEEASFHPLHEIWTRLVRGTCRVSDAFSDTETCYLVLQWAPALASRIESQKLQVLRLVLCGSGQKLVAIEHNRSCSTIATVARRELRSIGVDCRPSRVPMSLVLVALASHDLSERLHARLASFEVDEAQHLVVSIPRPDCDLSKLLPPAEAEVVRARLEGHSHRSIACQRRTSTRTIANQLASASRRLGTSGRLSIINRLVTGKGGFAPCALAS
jgi:DNA-binding NarL/FixJ family response regulator